MAHKPEKSKADYCSNYLNNTCIHPLAMVPQTPMRIFQPFWIAAFLVASGMLIYQVTMIVQAYRRYPVKIKSVDVPRSVMSFPAVTICNKNTFKKSKLRCTELEGLVKLEGEDSDESDSSGDGSGYPASGEKKEKCGTLQDWMNQPDFSGYESSGDLYESSAVSGEFSGGDGYSGYSGSSSDYGQFDYDDWSGIGSGSVDYGSSDYDSHMGPIEDPIDIATGTGEMELLTSFMKDIRKNQSSETAFKNLIENSKVDDMSDARSILVFTEKQARKYGYTKEEMFVECSFDNMNCNSSHFERFYSDRYGNCYTFNSMLATPNSRIRATRLFGPESGLKLTVDVDAKEYLGILSEAYGVKVVIHSPYLFPDLGTRGFPAGVGVMTEAAIRKKITTRKPAPFETKCESKVKDEYAYYSFVPQNEALHDTRACLEACIAKQIYECCNCFAGTGTYPRFLSKFKGTNMFSILNGTHASCRYKVSRRHLLEDSNPDALRCSCRPSCFEEDYSVSVFQASWPTTGLQQVMKKLKSETPMFQNMKESIEPKITTPFPGFYVNNDRLYRIHMANHAAQNLVCLHIYYENLIELRSEEIEEISFNQIFADVGGTMGIYMGITIMTFLEVLHLIIVWVVSKFERRGNQLQNTSKYSVFSM